MSKNWIFSDSFGGLKDLEAWTKKEQNNTWRESTSKKERKGWNNAQLIIMMSYHIVDDSSNCIATVCIAKFLLLL